MAANNSLSYDAYTNINQMEEGWQETDGKLIVYARIFGQEPKIYEITADHSPEIKSKVLKTYNDHNSSDPQIMKMVFADMQSLAPAMSYGTILWSHATNWAPAAEQIKTRSFGDDNFRRMDVQDLTKSLPTNLDFLIFDACSMASVEVLYELRHTAPYILASPTEVLSVGMPYHQIIPFLFNADSKQGLTSIAKNYLNYYQEKTGLEQSASFSLIDTYKLEAVAQATAQLLDRYSTLIPLIDRQQVQRLDLSTDTPVPAYDFLDLWEKNFPQEALKDLKIATQNAVLYKDHTASFLGNPIISFSGLSVYIPTQIEAEAYKSFYATLSWAKDAGYMRMFWWK